MAKYRVTYVDSCLREAVVEAGSPKAAEESVRRQLEHAQHHHVIDDWNDDWCTEPYKRPPIVNRTCFECGETRD